MKTKLFIIALLLLSLPLATLGQGVDTASVDLGGGVRLSILSANFGFAIRCAEDTETEEVVAEVIPQISIGPRYTILLRENWGLNGYLLFSSAEESKMYPTLGVGPSVKDHQVVLGYYLGPVSKAGEVEDWQKRIRIMVTFDLR